MYEYAAYAGSGKAMRLDCAVAQVDHADLRQTALALIKNAEVFEEVGVVNHDAGIVRHDFMPVRAAWIGDWRLDQPEVAPGIVDADVKRISVVVGIIFDALLARFENLPVAVGLLGRNEARFAGGVAGRHQKDVGLASRLECKHVEALVLLFIDQRVRSCRRDRVPIEAILALRDRIFLRVENRLIVVRPYDRSHALGVVGEGLSRAKVFHRQRELPETRVVVAVGEQVSVRAHGIRGDRHEGMPLGHFVLVEKDFFRRVRGRRLLAAADRILLPCLSSHVIKVVAFAIRNFDVGLFDPAQHLVIELFLERFGRLHHRIGVRILGFEIRAHFRVRLVAQPEIVVHQLSSVDLGDVRDFLRHRRRRQRRIVGGGE